ncbi:ArsR family transcriptional regulator [Ktedonosporobacter rubrisoli]|uniref:ArsR family transcriptional regulator n=1 Tax=Ktedonosporobacter rubrisoli TaxID=2509675 RepID=A0A4P6JNH5_KTERU|nr:transcriptional regulator [Ktedonosporobacter rubrisoli]QBD76867.1 ArsR family transcriptional regulator [Ktedonosporobacter rubrisoli]
MAIPEQSQADDTIVIKDNLQQVLSLDRTIHEPARLVILAALNQAEEVDFKFLEAITGLTKGNLSRQASNLEEAGYIQIRKYYKGKVPATSYRITPQGQQAFAAYWAQMASLQQSLQGKSQPSAEDENQEE